MTDHQNSSAGSASARAVDVIQCVLIERPEIGKAEAIRIIEALRSANLHVTGNAAQASKEQITAQVLLAMSDKVGSDTYGVSHALKINKGRAEKAAESILSLLASQPSPAATVETTDQFMADYKRDTLSGMIAAVYGQLDAEDCAMVDREWARQRGYILPTDGTSTLSRSSADNADETAPGQSLLECRDFIAALIGGAPFEGRAIEHARELIQNADTALATFNEPQTAPQFDPERVARLICRQDVPYNWQGKNRDAWVEIQWKSYLPRANALIEGLSASSQVTRPQSK